MNPHKQMSNAEIASEGQSWVQQKLESRGLIVERASGDPPGAHFVVRRSDGSWRAALQVRASHKRVPFWPIGDSFEQFVGAGNYCVFLRLDPKESGYEAYVVGSEDVALDSERAREENARRGNQDWTPWWPLPKDEPTRYSLEQAWLSFGKPRI